MDWTCLGWANQSNPAPTQDQEGLGLRPQACAFKNVANLVFCKLNCEYQILLLCYTIRDIFVC